eukprot:14295066-Heterocapsa_arctica.AAC.1
MLFAARKCVSISSICSAHITGPGVLLLHLSSSSLWPSAHSPAVLVVLEVVTLKCLRCPL